MENDVLESLSDLGYSGPLLDENKLLKALEQGPKSLDFNKLVCILADELKQLCSLEEVINVMNDESESNIFLFELSSFLKELGCPYSSLVTGHLSSRLQSKDEAALLLDYLISELMAARMVNVDKPKASDNMDIVMQETPTAKDLKDILIALKFNKPPPSITCELLFSKLEAKVRDMISKEGEQYFGKPLYNKSMTEKQWQELEKSYAELLEEYRLRRETLITRLECTVQSFEWSDRLKTQKDAIQAQYRPKRSNLKVKPDIKLSDFLAARTDLLQVEKTSSASVRKNTRSDVNKVIIGSVPDRGGRPNEQQPPPPEMPSWQQRSNPSAGGRGGRGGGAPRGGRVQGGYNQGQQGDRPQTSPANFNKSRNYQTYEVPAGGYNNQGGYNQQSGYQKNEGYNHTGYRPQSNRGGYNNSGQYNNNSGSYNNSSSGYNNSQGNYNSGQGNYNNGQGNYNNSQGQGNFNNSGGYNRYRNEHDDRTQTNYRGHSNYNRGGRR